MLPGLTVADSVDGVLADFQGASQLLLSERTGSDHSHVSFGEFGPRTLFPYRDKATFQCFRHVVCRSAEVQTARVTADWSITPVQDFSVFRNWSMKQPVGSYVGLNQAQFSVDGQAELSVSLGMGRGWPVPAPFIRWFSGHKPTKTLCFRQSFGAPKAVPSQGVTVPRESMTVGVAVPVSMNGQGASWYQTAHKQGV